MNAGKLTMNDEAITTAKNFLDLLTARDLPAAASYLHADAELVFPGGNTFTTLIAFVEWAQERYLDIEKTICGFDALSNADSTSTVYCYGTLNGHWTNGDEFQGIRFIDRFVISAGKIIRQEVWNDLAESQR